MLISSKKSFLAENGEQIFHITLDNEKGVRVCITNYGGIITHIYTPDKHGNSEDIVLGFDKPEDYYSAAYKQACAYFGAITGRFCNRIRDGKFIIDRKEFQLVLNSGIHHLHGGNRGFDKVVWKAETATRNDSAMVILSHLSPDGDQGYPGNLQTSVAYTLTMKGELIVDYSCDTDKPTPVNLTNHSYFNLSGNFKGDVTGHEVVIHSSHYTENDKSLIPTGRILPVEGSIFDFSKSSLISNKLKQMPEGYDLNFVLVVIPDKPALAARITEKISGRVLEVYTTEPGLQFFTYKDENFPMRLKEGIELNKFCGLAIEPQHFPDSPNHPQFPGTILRPGTTYRQRTIYKFSTKVTDS